MPQYIYTIDGVETPWPGAVPSTPIITPTPTPTIEPEPITMISEPEPTPTVPLVQSFGPSIMAACPPLPVTSANVPESVAAAWRSGDQTTYVNWFYGIDHAPYDTPDYDPAIVGPIMFSPTPRSGVGVTWSLIVPGNPTCYANLNVTYQGTQPPLTSTPGTVITDTTPAPGVMPPPVTPEILPAITQQIQQSIETPVVEAETTTDRLTGQVKGQLDYQLAQAALPLPKIEQRIVGNVLDTMGEVYQQAYPIGLGIPTVEEIVSGTPVYSPYGIGAEMPIPTPTPTPTEPTPTYTQPPTQPPGVACPAPVVQCPAPPDINFAPVINVNVPQQGEPKVTVEVPEGSYKPTEPTPTEPTPTEPTPAPTPAPTPTPEEMPAEVMEEFPEPEPEIPDILAPDYEEKAAAYERSQMTKLPTPLDWSTSAPCLAFQSRTQTWSTNWMQKILGVDNKKNVYGPVAWVKEIPVAGPILSDVLFGWLNDIALLIESIPGTLFGTAAGQSVPSFLALTISGLLDKYVGVPALYLARGFQYDLNYLFPQTIPSETDFVNLFLAGFIDQKTMECMVRANGSHFSWYKMLAGANRTRPNNDQIISLNRRGVLTDDQAYAELRGNGVLEQFDRDLLYRATESLPTVSDIVRFMVRDADDSSVADKYGTDSGLDTKYGDQLRAWAQGQGITDQVMKYYWRSHWEIPSNTALFEMLHRLRPDRKTSKVPEDATVTIDDVANALVVNDVLPYWAKRQIEISYKPLTRTDTQRAYFIDAITEEELYDSYRDLGYNHDNAERLVKFTNQLKAKRKQTTGGTEKAQSVLKYYKAWLIGDTEAKQRLMNGGLSEPAALEALRIAGQQRKNESQLICLKGIKSKYKRFQITDVEAQQELTKLGMAIENIAPVISNWNCERTYKPKELSAAQTCKAYQKNLIDDVEYRRRLSAIGYMEDESGILLEICRTQKGNENKGDKDTTRIRGSQEAMEQTEKARAVTEAAMKAIQAEGQ